MKLFIGGPTRDMVSAKFSVKAARLYAYTREFGPWGKNVDIDFLPSTYIHVGREQVLDYTLKEGFTHVFWLDTDMELPRETIVLLAMHDQPIVACNYKTRHGTDTYTACRGGSRIATTKDSTGLEAVDYVGMGAMLMRTEVVKDLGRPWFRHGLNDVGGDVGEDVMFCRGLRAAGYAVYIDHDLSKEVGHIGQHTYHTIDPSIEVAV